MTQKITIVFILLFVFSAHRYAQYCGAGKTYDSKNYIWASNTWIEKRTLENTDGVPFLQQPPLFPLILSISKPYQTSFASWLHTFCLVGTVWIWLYMAGKVLVDKTLWYFYGAFLACATPLYLVHQFIWSEPIFLFLVSIHFYALMCYTENQKGFWWLMLVSAHLFCLQRAIGFVFVGGTALALWAGKERLGAILGYVLGAMSGFGIWVGVVLASRTATEFAGTYGIQDSPVAGLKMLLESLSLWYWPAQAWWAGKVVCVAFFIVPYRWQGRGGAWFALAFSALFYIGVLCLKKSDFSDTERFVAVLCPILLLFLLSNLPAQLLRRKTLMVLFLGLLWLYPAARFVKNVQFWKKVQCERVGERAEKKSDNTLSDSEN